MKIVIDTNIIISGLLWSGKCSELMKKIYNKEIECLICDEIFEEVIKVLDCPKILKRIEKINTTKNEVIEFILENFIFIKIEKNINNYDIIDKDDIKFLQLSLENSVDFLISGDSHLLDVKNKYTNILSINDFFLNINTI